MTYAPAQQLRPMNSSPLRSRIIPRGLRAWRAAAAVGLASMVMFAGAAQAADFSTPEGAALTAALLHETELPVKEAWRPMLRALAELHGRSVLPPTGHFPFPFESLGPGYMGGRAFGHWDLTHERLDEVRAAPGHVRNQIRNELAGQQADGLIPGLVLLGVTGSPGAVTVNPSAAPTWKAFKAFPPVWMVAVDAYVAQTRDTAILRECLAALRRQIGWFEAKRRTPDGGFYYLDVTTNTWESGVDEGVRFLERPAAPGACVDATAHAFLLYDRAAAWSRQLGEPAEAWTAKAEALRVFIQRELWDPDSGFFYDRWSVRDPARRHRTFEGIWPLTVGAASAEQARRVIDEHLLNPQEFFTPHPIPTVARSDPKFELRMWRGPVWNSMTYWAARGCAAYGRADAARRILEAALDATAAEFARSGTIWEFYHPLQGRPNELQRKPGGRNLPCQDYVGHNPLFAMAELWRRSGGESRPARL
jgi:putative isomerase